MRAWSRAATRATWVVATLELAGAACFVDLGPAEGDETTQGSTSSAAGTGATTTTTGESTQAASSSGTTATTGAGSSTGACLNIACSIDGDGDGAGAPVDTPTLFCDACPPGMAPAVSDCDDGDDSVSPLHVEQCNGQDDNCDGLVDELSRDNSEYCAPCFVTQSSWGAFLWLCDAQFEWQSARERCQDRGGDLVVVDTPSKRDELVALLSLLPPGHYWIGLSDLESEGGYRWVDGQTLDDAVPAWATGEPTGTPEENCVMMNNEDDGAWSDLACDEFRYYLCEASAS